VTVEAEAPLINRTDASLGNTIEQDQIAELPIAGRNVVELLSLQPGVAYLGDNLNASTDTRSGAVNGVRSDQSNVTLDGIGVNDQNNGYAFTSVLNIPPDSVEEFRVTTANSNADSGYSSGAEVALVTKSGTNKFHGSAYEYNRNTMFSANDPFLRYSQISNGQPNKAPELSYNVFGVTLGGPIQKNRLFFFANPRAPPHCGTCPARNCVTVFSSTYAQTQRLVPAAASPAQAGKATRCRPATMRSRRNKLRALTHSESAPARESRVSSHNIRFPMRTPAMD
jgi:hypothetical protein